MLYCGTSGWNYEQWKHRFYPDGLPQEKWLSYYANRFNTVEINNSFYHLPEKKTFEHWREASPENFIFAVKASRYLTHMKKLKDPQEPLEKIIANSAGLGDRRGPILYQLPPYWHINICRLKSFLEILPKNNRHVFEFRDDSWQCDEVWQLLEEYGIGYCIMDAPELITHLKTTANYSYVRMHSGGEETQSNYTDKQLYIWAERVEELLKLGDVYIYFNNDYNAFAVNNAFTLKKMLGVEA